MNNENENKSKANDGTSDAQAASGNGSSLDISSATNENIGTSTVDIDATPSTSSSALRIRATAGTTTREVSATTTPAAAAAAAAAGAARSTTATGVSHRHSSGRTNNAQRRNVKRSTIKQLIESYFFQLQRGCGNPRCDNEHCASSGKVKQMSPNETAAMALQLFSQDAKLCNAQESGGGDSASTSGVRGRRCRTTETEMFSPNEFNLSSASTSSGNSTVTLASSAESTESSSSTTSPTTTTSAADPFSINSTMTDRSQAQAAALSPAAVARCSSNIAHLQQELDDDDDDDDDDIACSSRGQRRHTDMGANTLYFNSKNGGILEMLMRSRMPPFLPIPIAAEPVLCLNEKITNRLIKECDSFDGYERLKHAICEVFSSVERLSASFHLADAATVRPIAALTDMKLQIDTDTEGTDPDEQAAAVAAISAALNSQIYNGNERISICGSNSSSRSSIASIQCTAEMNKEALRTLEGETDKDEDSTQLPSTSAASFLGVAAAAAAETSVPTTDINTFSPLRGEVLDLNAAIAELDALQQDTQQSNSLFNHFFPDDDTSQIGAMSLNSDYSHWGDIEIIRTFYIDLDFNGLRGFKQKLIDLHFPDLNDILNSSLVQLADSICDDSDRDWDKVLHCLVICYDMIMSSPLSHSEMEFVDRALPKLCRATSLLPTQKQARLARIWSAHCKERLRSLVECCQQLVTLQVIADEDNVQDNWDVIAATKVLRIVYYASIMAGEIDMPSAACLLNDDASAIADSYLDSFSSAGAVGGAVGGFDDDSAIAGTSTGINGEDDGFSFADVFGLNIQRHENRLETLLGISPMDGRVPYVPFEEFYNEPLSDAIHMDNDYLAYKNLLMDPHNEDNHFSFMCYSFILNPACKVVALYYDSRIRMYSERNSSLYSLLSFYNVEGDVRPDLRLKVRRDKLINDALSGLEMVAMSNPKDLKKQLVVEFVGEQGIDEGGVSKEFFQLIIEEIFNPDIGMFVPIEETNTMWFNSSALENEAQFTLIGIILGLAIYNNIILAVNFPKVVYRKLMNGRGTFYDLKDWSPTLYRSLDYLLKYDKPDIDEVFMQTFKINYVTVFGQTMEHDLKPGCGEVAVTQKNKKEFVDLYADFLLNKLIERQFRAFKKGFDMVTDESPLKLLFRPEEIELLVCGSRKFDFKELEKSTEYEGGYTKESQIIKDFWIIVHAMSMESKRKLLEFTTGSDRVPVGGFSRLKLLITRNGPDSDRLPTSHTCFNVLLLPEYSSRDKLEERLLKAINYSKGFGML